MGAEHPRCIQSLYHLTVWRGPLGDTKVIGWERQPNLEVHNPEFTTALWRSLRCWKTFQKVHQYLKNCHCDSFLTLGEIKISTYTNNQDEGGQANKNIQCPCSGLELNHPRVTPFICSCRSAAVGGHDTGAQSLFRNGSTNSFTPYAVLLGKKNFHSYELHQVQPIKGYPWWRKVGKILT